MQTMRRDARMGHVSPPGRVRYDGRRLWGMMAGIHVQMIFSVRLAKPGLWSSCSRCFVRSVRETNRQSHPIPNRNLNRNLNHNRNPHRINLNHNLNLNRKWNLKRNLNLNLNLGEACSLRFVRRASACHVPSGSVAARPAISGRRTKSRPCAAQKVWKESK